MDGECSLSCVESGGSGPPVCWVAALSVVWQVSVSEFSTSTLIIAAHGAWSKPSLKLRVRNVISQHGAFGETWCKTLL